MKKVNNIFVILCGVMTFAYGMRVSASVFFGSYTFGGMVVLGTIGLSISALAVAMVVCGWEK